VAREPAISFRGALRILGHHDRPWLDRLDRLLGGVILASGAVPAVGALWGWVDQKNEATGLVRGALDAVSGRLARTGGLARHELVVAAHTTLVLAAFFDTLRAYLRQQYEQAAFTEAEKIMLGTGKWQGEGEPLVRHLYSAEIPSPSAVRGFEENVKVVARWALDRSNSIRDFLEGIGFEPVLMDRAFADAVAERYRSDYLTLATTVPEFKVWADLGEHAATRMALARLADLLTQPASPQRGVRMLLTEVNRAELDRPVIDIDIDGYGIDAVFPTVRDIFITPHFKSVPAAQSTRVGDEHWWEKKFLSRDLDVVLARHFSTPDATRLPLLLLGHPGAGKSLLTKVLAAQLPDSTYTVVRVPLRQVDADANVATQVQQALDVTTNGRVSWPELSNQSDDTIRVILLDGLDELLQATTNDRGGYLTDVVEFQRIEAALGKPVAVVVTSRTLVADRVRIPDGTPVVKLEDFDDAQVRQWLQVWNGVNSRPVSPDIVMAQGELAQQPLLLLMLTLYFADPNVELPDTDLSIAELYERLLDTYARREVTKHAGRVLPADELAEAIRTQLIRLSIAALGMFNRGRQSITEAELSADVAGLGEPAPSGDRLLGEFFFVHAPEANEGSARGYEFLHATFGEYLVANRVVEVLADVAEAAFGLRRPREPDDELLFAALSYQPLAIQPPILEFVYERFAAMEVADVVRTLDLLIPAYRHRRTATRYPDYRPLPADTVRALAAYSANLVLLRVLADPAGVELTTWWPDEEQGKWRAMVDLWAAGLDAHSYRGMLDAVGRVDDIITVKERTWRDHMISGDLLHAAHLRDDRNSERLLRFGDAVMHGLIAPAHLDDPRNWADAVLSGLLALTTGTRAGWYWSDAPESISWKTTNRIANTAYWVLGVHCVQWSPDETERFLRWLMRLRTVGPLPPGPLALVEQVHTGLLDSLRTDPDPEWTDEWRTLLRAATPENLGQIVIGANYLRQLRPAEWPFLAVYDEER
jgi:hypothetical protein